MMTMAVMAGFGAKAQISYGAKAGVNLAKMQFSAEGVSISPSNITNFYVTGYLDAPIAPSLSIQPGISLQGKGMSIKVLNEKATTNLMYLEIPVNFVYYLPAGSGDVFIGAGPYAGFGLTGKEKFNDESQDVEWGGDDGMKRFDAGANFLLGYKLSNGFLINAGYGLGLTNVAPSDEGSVKNRVLSFGVGFQF